MSNNPSKPYFSIIIPIRDEAGNILPLLNDIRSTMDHLLKPYEVLFINDHSIDSSAERIDQAIRKSKCRDNANTFSPTVKKIELRTNKGKSAALRAGLRQVSGEIVILMDGDRQNSPSDIPRLLDRIENCDMVCGVRTNRKDATQRLISSKIANQFRNWITGDNIIDSGCQLQAMTRRCADVLAVLPFRLFDTDYYFYPTILKNKGYKVVQVRVTHWARTNGTTKYKAVQGRFLSGLAACIKIRRILKRLPNKA